MADEKPKTLEDVYRLAVDAGVPRVNWIFLKARAIGRREIAASKLKRLEAEDYFVKCKASVMESQAAAELILANAPSYLAFHQIEQELADAVEMVTACDGVIEALARTPVVPLRSAQPQEQQRKQEGRK